MNCDPTITHWIPRLKEGDAQAVAEIWRTFFDRLVRFADGRLNDRNIRTVDGEDVALSALKSVVLGIQGQEFERLESSNDLWKLVLTVTRRKVTAARRRHFAGKRPDAHVRNMDSADDQEAFEQSIPDDQATPDLLAQLSDELQHFFARLPDDEIRQIAVWRLEGFSNREIAEKLSSYERRIERKMQIVREVWGADA